MLFTVVVQSPALGEAGKTAAEGGKTGAANADSHKGMDKDTLQRFVKDDAGEKVDFGDVARDGKILCTLRDDGFLSIALSSDIKIQFRNNKHDIAKEGAYREGTLLANYKGKNGENRKSTLIVTSHGIDFNGAVRVDGVYFENSTPASGKGEPRKTITTVSRMVDTADGKGHYVTGIVERIEGVDLFQAEGAKVTLAVGSTLGKFKAVEGTDGLVQMEFVGTSAGVRLRPGETVEDTETGVVVRGGPGRGGKGSTTSVRSAGRRNRGNDK
jgi:hypothetical protein